MARELRSAVGALVSADPAEFDDAALGALLVGPRQRECPGPTGLALLACDPAITRVLATGASQPLDVGRATRLVTVGNRTALAVP